MVEFAEKKKTSVASHTTLLAAFEKESIVLTTSSDKACVKEGYPSFQNRQRWVQIIGEMGINTWQETAGDTTGHPGHVFWNEVGTR